MYGMVLMAALTTTTDVSPSWGHRCGCCGYSCCGCYGGCYGCGGCWGGCYGCGGCMGGCGGGCWGCWGGYSTWWGGCGGCMGCMGCYGGCMGCMGCAGCYGGLGGVGIGGGIGYDGVGLGAGVGGGMITNPVGTGTGTGTGGTGDTGDTGDSEGLKKPKDGKGKGGTTMLPTKAQLVVELPSDARLFIDDHQMKTPSGKRTFNTPRLQPGQTYYYILRAEVEREGKTVAKTQRVLIRAGDTVRASFSELQAGDSVAQAQGR